MADDTPLYFDCMNESGLAAGGLLFAGFAEYEAKPVEGKLNVTAYELPLWVCRNFTTVDQAQAALEHVAILGEGIAGMEPSYLHWMIADGTRSIVAECMADGMHIHDDKADVLGNQPAFDWHLENLRSYYMVDPCVLEAPVAHRRPCRLRHRRRYARPSRRLLLHLPLRQSRIPERPGVDYDTFVSLLDGHITYYNSARIKESLGWMSPVEYRKSMGLAA